MCAHTSKSKYTHMNHACIGDYSTQALTENCIVCRSQRTEVALEPAVAEVPEVLVDPAW